MVQNPKESCPRCGFVKMKEWTELTADEQFLAERLPMSADYTRRERKRHRFCTRCWFEETGKTPQTA